MQFDSDGEAWRSTNDLLDEAGMGDALMRMEIEAKWLADRGQLNEAVVITRLMRAIRMIGSQRALNPAVH